jgi:hypothetical protein
MADLLALVGTVTFIETVKEVRKIISKKTRIKISQ